MNNPFHVKKTSNALGADRVIYQEPITRDLPSHIHP